MKHTSPPTFYSPIYEGAQIVGILGMAGYQVSVYANGTELVGQGQLSPLGWGPVKLNRPLKKGEWITATQSNNGDTSKPTWPKHAVTVDEIPFDRLINGEKFKSPEVVEPLYECQAGFWIEDLTEGVQATYELLNPATESGGAWTPYGNAIIRVQAPKGLEEHQQVRAAQSFASWPFPVGSDASTTKTVQAAPPLDDDRFKPKIIKDVNNDGIEDVSIGTTQLKVDNTITGAKVRIFTKDASTGKETEFGVGVVAGNKSTVFVQPLPTTDIQAQQWLCDDAPKSPPSDPVKLKSVINLPEIEEPICAGAIEVTIHKTEPGANVEIEVKRFRQANFVSIGAKTASWTTTTVVIGGGVPLQAGDQIRAQQSNGTLVSNWTAAVPVKDDQAPPIVEVRNGLQHPAVPGNAPVFYRGVLISGKYGPSFRAIKCGAKRAIVRIIAPIARDLQEIEVVELTETKEGYFEGGWDWQHTGWKIPDDIPVGVYTARFVVTGSTGTHIADKKFFVAFDPQEVRKNVVAAAQTVKAKFGCDALCPDGTIGCCSSKNMGQGLKEPEVNKFFTGSPPWINDCLGAALIIMARGLILTLKTGEFDQLGYTTSDMHLEFRPVTHISQMMVGDWGYIRNDWSYLDKHPGGSFQGENVIKVSASTYYGFPVGTKTYAKWVQTLIDAYNSGLPQSEHISSIPGFIGDSIQFFDATSVSVDVWNLKKP